METPPARSDTFEPDRVAAQRIIATALTAGKSWLDPEDTSAILAAYGVPMVANHFAADPDQAASLAAAIGFPVALKIRSPDITHKSDVGGVALNLGSTEGVRREAEGMLEQVKAAHPEVRLHGFLVQPMVRRPGAIELLVGLVEDATFGPLVAFGQGGTAVEIVRDTSLELPPLNALLVHRLMARTRIWQLLQGYRGKPTANIEAIVEVLIHLGQLAADHPEIRELDINPAARRCHRCRRPRCSAAHRAGPKSRVWRAWPLRLIPKNSRPPNGCEMGRCSDYGHCVRRTSHYCMTSPRI